MCLFIAFALLAASVCIGVHAQEHQTTAPQEDAILVFDASGSMWAQMNGRPRIVVAKEVILGLLDDLPSNLNLGLVAYGHNRKGDCSDIEKLVPVGGGRDAIRAAIKDISPKGKTPMTAAVIQAAKALKYTENKATVILVSDGKESCDMDPCAAARKLEKLGVGLTVHGIGFGLKKGSKGLSQVQCIAEETGGKFFAANNAEELGAALKQVSKAEPEPPAKVEVHLSATDQKGGPVIEQGLIWTVRNGATGKIVYQSAAPEGSVTAEMLRGVHDVSVLRGSDEAGADGEIETGTNGTTVTLPIVVKLKASLKAPNSAPAGSEVRVSWDGPNAKHDYISVAWLEAEDGDQINYVRTSAGNPLKLRLPDAPGHYEIRYVSNVNDTVLARHAIEATEIKATLKAPATAAAGSVVDIQWTGPGYKHDYIAVSAPGSDDDAEINYVRVKKGEEAELQLPDAPGDYELRYVLNQSREVLDRRPIKATAVTATLEAPATAPAGSVVDIQWTGPGYKHDFIAVSVAGSDDGERVNYVRVTKGEEAELRLPDALGNYELRYVLDQSREILARRPIKATEITATLEAPATAAAGSVVDIQWTGPGYKHDYIAVSAVGSDDDEEINYVRVRKGQEAELRLPDAPGDYELRYVLNQSREVLARRPIEVTLPKEMQRGVDRPGSDYRSFDTKGAGPTACLDACREDSRCRAWSWTKPGHQSAGGQMLTQGRRAQATTDASGCFGGRASVRG